MSKKVIKIFVFAYFQGPIFKALALFEKDGLKWAKMADLIRKSDQGMLGQVKAACI